MTSGLKIFGHLVILPWKYETKILGALKEAKFQSDCLRVFESAKLRAWRACVLTCLACSTCLRACVFTCLACSRAYVLGVFTCLRAHVLGVLTCLRAHVIGVLACLYVRALLTCFLWCVLCVFTINLLTFLSNYLFCLHKSRLCN